MYIIDTPIDREKCIQARNRAFRVCSHYKVTQKGPTHTVKYVLVERQDTDRNIQIHRGALAVATAHSKDQSGSLLADAQRLELSGSAKLNGITVTDPTPIAMHLIDKAHKDYRPLVANPVRFAQYVDNKEITEIKLKGAVTVFDVSSYLKENRNKQATAYDGRIKNLLGVTASKSPAVAFDEPGGLYCAHHTLRGITFEHKLKLPEPSGNGELILQYSGVSKKDVGSVMHIGDEKEPVRLESALGSTTVYTGVRTVYYVKAHKIQCIGHARFECFRAIGLLTGDKIKPPTRVFVGTQDRFHSFIGMLSSGYGYRGNCSDDEHENKKEKKYTPMVIAMELRRVLLAGHTCVVSINNKLGYKERLAAYLKEELEVDEWKDLISFNYGEPTDDVSITVKRGEKVVGRKELSVSKSDYADSLTDIGTTKGEEAKSDVLYVLPDDKYDTEEYKDCTKADFAPTIDLRTTGKNRKFKTRVGHHSNLRCTMVIFVGTYTDWDTMRITARKYFSK
jgi:hypothetical protein